MYRSAHSGRKKPQGMDTSSLVKSGGGKEEIEEVEEVVLLRGALK